MRTSVINRKTNETDIELSLNLDGSGVFSIDSGCGFMNHMLTLFAVHSGFDISIKCIGDTDVDDHHSVEDIGIALGLAFKEALGDKKGVNRYADKIIPMDEALILTAVDISGRGNLFFDMDMPSEKIGSFDTELIKEFWIAFASNADITLHVKKLSGENSHHIAEGCFKSAARSLSYAASINSEKPDTIPSSKGVL